MSKKFDSVLASRMGDFVRSPLGVKDTGVSNRAVHMIARSGEIRDTNFVAWDETLFRLSLDDLSQAVIEARPPWWPAPHPIIGQVWQGDSISGDIDTVWYSAINLVDFLGSDLRNVGLLDERWTIDIYRLDRNLEVVNSWRWHQPFLGGGRAWHITPFGDSTALWGLVRVHTEPQPWMYTHTDEPREMYLVELDPETMEIRRMSNDLYGSDGIDIRIRRPYATAGGGTSSAIWVSRRFTEDDAPDASNSRTQIMEYSPADFSLVRVTDGPRSALPFPEKRQITGLGGDAQSIWIASIKNTLPRTSLSELPRDFSNANRTILQDEIQAPVNTTFDFPGAMDIG